ncbi:serine/threonine-protein kinase atg1-like [Octopus sinensis]|uniref:Serine/threonine-protein kinase atg1-like n=1 Tax=Octopus sinensis TaxID=2607531 RepID=A0A7E6EHH4_9MOLL|nr:serine/threonine-protein kinase atg1-like [Octopus sinensis]
MQAYNTKLAERNDEPPGYYEYHGYTTDFYNASTSGHSEQPGYLPSTAYTPHSEYPPPPAYTPQPENTPLSEYPPQSGCPLQTGYPPLPGYPSEPSPVLQQPSQQQQQQQLQRQQQQESDTTEDQLKESVINIRRTIIATLFCCFPSGIVALVSAVKAYKMAKNGNLEGATRANNTAKQFIKLSHFAAFLAYILYVILILINFT